MLYKILDIDGNRIGISFHDGNMSASFKAYRYKDNSISLDKFLSGKINNTLFESQFDTDNLSFKTIGRGRKPQRDIDAMKYFINECIKYSNDIKI